MTQTQPLLDTIVSPETQARFADAVASLANALGVAASHVYEVLIRQAVSQGVAYAIGAGACAVAAVWIGRLASKAVKDKEDYSPPLVFLTIVAACGAVFAASQCAMHLINPEYYAIKEVMSLLK